MNHPPKNGNQASNDPFLMELCERGIVLIEDHRITYKLNEPRTYRWTNPEEWVRAKTLGFLIVEKGYPANRIRTEHRVPKRTPSDRADTVVFEDDKCRSPYLVVENKAEGQTKADQRQAIEQMFGNAHSLRAPLGLYDEGRHSIAFDLVNYPAQEREDNRIGTRSSLPKLYGNVPNYALVAGSENDIRGLSASHLSTCIRRAHSTIWAGGKRDPLKAFDEWSKLLFAKVVDERSTKSGQPRRFQIGTNETTASVATRVRSLFKEGSRIDPSIFSQDARIDLPDSKVFDVVGIIQEVSFTRSDIDSIGRAFENFFGSVFRGELGQYFTMRPLARFIVAALQIGPEDFVIDPTAGSGGFLLEVLMQVWQRIERDFGGQPSDEISRIKTEFSLHRVFGIEIHETLARICKINLLLHHDGHTNVEGDRSCLDSTFTLPRLKEWAGKFTCLVGNPPFGDDIEEGDRDTLGDGVLEGFQLANGRTSLPSEQVIIERAIDLLEPGGRFGLVVPDGLLNNQGHQSNCPQTRRFLVQQGFILAIISLPDHAFRHSGAQNKTSVVLFRKFTSSEKQTFNQFSIGTDGADSDMDDSIVASYDNFNRYVFLAEANQIGYSTTGALIDANELYCMSVDGKHVEQNVKNTILGEYERFMSSPTSYVSTLAPDCMSIRFSDLWRAHKSHRIDPKYHLFKRLESSHVPSGWCTARISTIMRRRDERIYPEQHPDQTYQVMTVSQDGEIRQRQAGKGKSPPEWLGMYFEGSSSKWFSAREGDVVFSSIDLWKGCIAVVPPEFDRALVTLEFPIYEILDSRLSPNFLSALLRCRYYQRAFRAITTGHSNRRRTQSDDFETLEVAFPTDPEEQSRLIQVILASREDIRSSIESLRSATLRFDDVIDGRGDEQLSEILSDSIHQLQ